MYPHVVQFETSRREFDRKLQLIRERKQATTSSRRSSAPRGAGLLATSGSGNPELEHELTIERTMS